jgi:membrane protease YdiL (CAAX protease family)
VTSPANPDTDAPRWGLLEPFVAWVVGTFAAAAFAALAAVATGVSVTRSTLPIVIASLVAMWAVYVAAIVITSKRKGSGDPIRDVRLRFAGWQDIAMGVLAGLVTSLLLVNAVYLVLERIGLVDQNELKRLDAPARELSALAKGPSFFVLALFVGFGAPLVEEVFFRGFLQPALIRRTGPLAGVVLTAVFFAGAHLQPLQFPALFVFGLVVGTLAYKTKRLGPGIAAHIAFNGLTLLVLASQR